MGTDPKIYTHTNMYVSWVIKMSMYLTYPLINQQISLSRSWVAFHKWENLSLGLKHVAGLKTSICGISEQSVLDSPSLSSLGSRFPQPCCFPQPCLAPRPSLQSQLQESSAALQFLTSLCFWYTKYGLDHSLCEQHHITKFAPRIVSSPSQGFTAHSPQSPHCLSTDSHNDGFPLLCCNLTGVVLKRFPL